MAKNNEHGMNRFHHIDEAPTEFGLMGNDLKSNNEKLFP